MPEAVEDPHALDDFRLLVARVDEFQVSVKGSFIYMKERGSSKNDGVTSCLPLNEA